jgi:quercetin dioxygenase-like cupin family protein
MERVTEPGPAAQPLAFVAAHATQAELAGLNPFPGVLMRLWSGGRVTMNFLTIAAGSDVPWHSHPHEQLGVVLEGELHLIVGAEDAEPWVLHPGDVYAVPPHTGHRATSGPEGTRALDIFAPPREDYLARATSILGADT